MYCAQSLHLKFIVVVVLSLFIISCGTTSNKQEEEDLTYILQSSFGNLYLSHYGLEFPGTENSLKRCIEYNSEACLRVYHKVLAARDTITSLPPEEALEITLDIIERACLSKNKRMANSVCYGGIMSLYFYNSDDQDIKILARLKKYPKKVRSLIFNTEFLWYHNRLDNHIWINYISMADVDWEDKLQKSFVLDMFRKRIDELDHKPWVLFSSE